MRKIVLITSIRDCLPNYVHHWVGYHLSIGFDHIYLYDNESNEPVRVKNDKVSIKRWPGAHGQISAFNDGLACARADGAEWVAFLDDDEYLIIPDATVPEFLGAAPLAVPGVSLNWLNFGTSGKFGPAVDGDVFANFTKHYKKDAEIHKHVKSISRVRDIAAIVNPHFCVYNGTVLAVDTSGRSVKGAFTESPLHTKAWINHYYTRSRSDYLRKSARGRGTVRGFPYTEELLAEVDRSCTETYTGEKGKVVG